MISSAFSSLIIIIGRYVVYLRNYAVDIRLIRCPVNSALDKNMRNSNLMLLVTAGRYVQEEAGCHNTMMRKTTLRTEDRSAGAVTIHKWVN